MKKRMGTTTECWDHRKESLNYSSILESFFIRITEKKVELLNTRDNGQENLKLQ